jgi:hypothetical protein
MALMSHPLIAFVYYLDRLIHAACGFRQRSDYAGWFRVGSKPFEPDISVAAERHGRGVHIELMKSWLDRVTRMQGGAGAVCGGPRRHRCAGPFNRTTDLVWGHVRLIIACDVEHPSRGVVLHRQPGPANDRQSDPMSRALPRRRTDELNGPR